jgi:hypothetical protein
MFLQQQVEGLMMVESKNVPKNSEDFDIGCGNAFGGEGEDAGPPADVEMVNNVVSGFDYNQTTMDGAGFKAWMKDYMGAILEVMKKKDVPVEERKAFKGRAANIAKFLLSNFKDLEFYIGPDFNPESMIFSMYPEGAHYPNFYYIRDGLKEEKY